VVGVPDATIESVVQRTGVRVRRVGVEAVPAAVDPRRTLAVVADASAGVGLAQAVHHADPHVAVVLLGHDAAECEELRAVLAITPGIGRHTTCVATGPDGWEDALADELDRAQLRQQHHQTLVQVRGAIGTFEGTPPETLSVYLGQLFEHAPIGILLTDPAGVVRSANPQSGEVLGRPPQQAVGSSLPSLFSGQEADIAADLIRACVRSGDPGRVTLTRTMADGALQHLDVTVAPVDPDHWDLGVFVLLRDETARIRAIEAGELARRTAETDAERYAELAWTLQESLLPPDLPAIEGIEVAARFHPAGDGSEIGGDFYDIFEVRDDEWFAVVGDVCGKGAGAARLTALTRYTLRATGMRIRNLERNLADLNAVLAHQYDQDRQRNEHRFATAAVVRFRRAPDGGVLVRAGSGGHPAPLVLRLDGTVEELACRGPLLGVFETGTFVTGTTRLEPGEVLVLHTDGVTEARRGREEFGEHRLRELLASKLGRPAESVAGAIQAAVLEFQGGVARDDIAVLAVRAAEIS